MSRVVEVHPPELGRARTPRAAAARVHPCTPDQRGSSLLVVAREALRTSRAVWFVTRTAPWGDGGAERGAPLGASRGRV